MEPLNTSRPTRVLTTDRAWPLHDTVASRSIEAIAAAALPPHTLMARAGMALARLALAVAPGARRIWVAAGPGNNGGDGFEAAWHLHRAGMAVTVCWQGDPARLPADAAAAYAQANGAHVPIVATLPSIDGGDVAIDALLGLGARRPPDATLAGTVDALNRSRGVRLAVDLPTGLDADTGAVLGTAAVRATHTLALLTLKPGLFTAQGRDHAGEVWFDALDVDPAPMGIAPSAWLAGPEPWQRVRPPRAHGGHKGRFGDVIVVGGAAGMTGAAVLAARSALAAGAGRVFVCPLDPDSPMLDANQPELMWREAAWSQSRDVLRDATVVCGCGGGDAVAALLPALLSCTARLVIDADALNAIARDVSLQAMLRARAGHGHATVLTPHPLEAARLAGHLDAAMIQADRVAAARQLADRWACTVLLKGSGTVIAVPDEPACINATGNARLGSAGTGDVLAGWLAGLWSASRSARAVASVADVAKAAAWSHGLAAESSDLAAPLVASRLIERLAATSCSAAPAAPR